MTPGSPYKVKMAKKPVRQIGVFPKSLRATPLPSSPMSNKQFRGGQLAPLHQTNGFKLNDTKIT